ncbi:hypothetical protein PODOV084v1_p0011 [Vibrio phage 340E47.2]|nr:hypothetical protein PODOV084v1_p0011 [Vibrio phage 340E47.2]QZI91915.1 hypothetical protein PODOV077v1_p0004 [Vibrio phage 5P1a]
METIILYVAIFAVIFVALFYLAEKLHKRGIKEELPLAKGSFLAVRNPATVEAIVWDGDNTEEVLAFLDRNGEPVSLNGEDYIAVYMMNDTHYAKVGDIIILGEYSVFDVVSPSAFERRYTVKK